MIIKVTVSLFYTIVIKAGVAIYIFFFKVLKTYLAIACLTRHELKAWVYG